MWTSILDLAKRYGGLDALGHLLVSQPDKASVKLAEALGEVVPTVEALDVEIVRYLSLHFGGDDSIARGRAVLLGMEVGQSGIRINQARGHCHRIKHIYETYLDKWFDKLFAKSSAERNELRTIFEGLGTADDYVIAAMNEVSSWEEVEAEVTLDLVDLGDLSGANARIHQARVAAKPARKELVKTASRLRALQADFIRSAQIV